MKSELGTLNMQLELLQSGDHDDTIRDVKTKITTIWAYLKSDFLVTPIAVGLTGQPRLLCPIRKWITSDASKFVKGFEERAGFTAKVSA